MMNGILTTGGEILDDLAVFLAAAFGVASGGVDVCDGDDYENRNWDALVTCAYRRIKGDLAWSLELTTDPAVTDEPSEESLARGLAGVLGVFVVFPTDYAENPWIDRLATPDGRVAYANVAEEGDEGERFRVISCEIPTSAFPGAEVTRYPELIRSIQLPTPLTDACVPDGLLDPVRDEWPLANWERLGVRMDSNWPPSAWYPVEMYREDLELRDATDDVATRIPVTAVAGYLEAREAIDARYRALTVDDGGVTFSRATGMSITDILAKPWYWRRRPAQIPWEENGDPSGGGSKD